MTIEPITDFRLVLDTKAALLSLPEYAQDAAVGALTHMQPPPERSKGVHVSGVIAAVARKLGKLDPEDTDQASSDYLGISIDATLRISLGLAFEDWISRRIPLWKPHTDYLYHPQEYCRDEIYNSPDAQWATLDEFGHDEYKCTWKSARRDMHDEWMWIKATLSYAAAAECGITRARWFIYHVLGDYTYPLKPTLLAWDIGFTEAEAEACWQHVILPNRHLADVEY